MNNNIRNIANSIMWNWRVLLLFEFIYRVIGGVIIFPLLHGLINFTITKARIEYLDLENLKVWVSYPLTIPILIICLLILGVYVMLEMSAMVQYFYSYNKREILNVVQLLSISLKRAIHVVMPKNWLLLFLVMFLFPITTFVLTPNVLSNLSIPEYIVDFIQEQGNIYIIYILFLIVTNLIIFYTIYSIPVFILEDTSFFNACKKSYKIMKKNFFKTLFNYLLWMAFVLIIFFLICGGVLLFNIIRFRYIQYNNLSSKNFLLSYIRLKQYATFILHVVIFSASFAFVMNNYFKYTRENTIGFYRKKTRGLTLIIGIVELVLIFIAIGFYIDYQGDEPTMNYLLNNKQDIVAHRACGIFAPENTLQALEKAIESKATYAEIDVQQSKDGVLVVLHDTNFKRTTGVNKNVWDANYKEIKTYNAGGYYYSQFEKVKVPTLEEMIQKADGKIKLMIELKNNGHKTKDFEEDAVNLIKKYNFENQCTVASLDLNILHRVKKLNKNIKTVYITPFVYGEYYKMPDVDMFSIEETFVNKHSVFRIHLENKKVFVWTVNKDSAIKRVLSLPIDGIVTDNPKLASYYRAEGSGDMFIYDLIENLFPS